MARALPLPFDADFGLSGWGSYQLICAANHEVECDLGHRHQQKSLEFELSWVVTLK
jgi:hypothetical protein